MQIHTRGYQTGDPRIKPAAGVGIDRSSELPDEMDVLIVGTGPSAAVVVTFPEGFSQRSPLRSGARDQPAVAWLPVGGSFLQGRSRPPCHTNEILAINHIKREYIPTAQTPGQWLPLRAW